MAPPVHYHMGKFPPEKLDLVQLMPLASKAIHALGRYDGLLSAIPEASLLISPLVTQEAVLSSKIEGTHITMGEVLEIEAGAQREGITQPKRDDAEEILNYRDALAGCAKEIQTKPLSQHLLRQAHAVLMRGVRGRDKNPGAFRTEQNWIGERGCTPLTAGFIPIAPEHLASGMDNWSNYLRLEEKVDPLIQLAIIHIEFEALHPFMDGNGRLGRMLIPLFLYSRNILSSPSFYMSGYLDRNRDFYLEKLRAVSRDGAWSDWCAFFIEGIREQAIDNEVKARAILALYDKVKKQVVEITHSQHALGAVDFLFRWPIFFTPSFIKYSDIPKPTAARIVTLLQQNEILHMVRAGSGRRPSLFCFRELINIAEGRQLF